MDNEIIVIRTMEYYPAIKINEVLIRTMLWINLQSIVLSERSKTQMAIYFIPFIQHSGKDEIIETKIWSVVARG